ncbi:peptidase inhibitor family I36 protein [Actinokineospora sp. 24-640]
MRKIHAIRVGVVTALAALGAVLVPSLAVAAPGTAQYCVGDLDTGTVSCHVSKAVADTAQPRTALWTVHVILYDGTGYGGAAIELGSADPTCSVTTGDVEGVQPDLRTYGWNNRASSFVTRNQCDMKLYDGINYGPASTGYLDHSINLGNIGWNNRLSSFKTS